MSNEENLTLKPRDKVVLLASLLNRLRYLPGFHQGKDNKLREFLESLLAPELLGKVELQKLGEDDMRDIEALIENAEKTAHRDWSMPYTQMEKGLKPILSLLEEGKSEYDPEKESGIVARVKELKIDKDTLFPVPESNIERGFHQEAKSLLSRFRQELHDLPKQSFKAFYISLIHLLRRYTWCIPGSEDRVISLYDRARITAAVTWALHKGENENPFTLIQGDINGIQNFIYTLASPNEAQAKMAKRLRARSLYVSLLTESAARKMMRTLALPETSMIMCGGGGFLLLAPNTADTEEILNKATRDIDEYLLEKHHGRLGISVACVDASKEELRDSFQKKMECLLERMGRSKLRRFSTQEKWPEPNSDREECRVCGVPTDGNTTEKDEETGESVIVCKDCKHHGELGGNLHKAKYLAWSWTGESGENKQSNWEFNILGQRWRFYEELKEIESENSGLEGSIIYNIEEPELPEVVHYDAAVGFRLMATHVPDTFEKMAKRAEGAQYLAGLQVDVDNMGYLLAKGIPSNLNGLATHAAISHWLDLFFSGYINKIVREDKDHDKLYIVYAGGDDLFIVGAWDAVLYKASQISQDFNAYTGNSKELHLSAGYYIFKPKFPIGRAAEHTGEQEKKAKKAEGKNSLCAFGETLKWDKVAYGLEFADVLCRYVDDERISKGFVQTMLTIYHNDFKKKKIIWNSRVYYHLARNVNPSKAAETKEDKEQSKVEAINHLKKALLEGKKEGMDTAQLWANVVLLKQRETKDNNKTTNEEE